MRSFLAEVLPHIRRVAIISGFTTAPVSAMMWLFGGNPTGFFVFIALVAFLLGAKAEDDPS